MTTLNIKYAYFLCENSLTVSGKLYQLFEEYKQEFCINDNLNFDYSDEELEKFLINLIDCSEYRDGPNYNINIDSMLINYYRLSDLIIYMHNIKYLMSKQKLILEETLLVTPALQDYQFEDSLLADISIDNQHHVCKILLRNVLQYNEKRQNKNNIVDCGSALLIFHNSEQIGLKGEISAGCMKANKVYAWQPGIIKDYQRAHYVFAYWF
jgi:hypothetical protein